MTFNKDKFIILYTPMNENINFFELKRIKKFNQPDITPDGYGSFTAAILEHECWTRTAEILMQSARQAPHAERMKYFLQVLHSYIDVYLKKSDKTHGACSALRKISIFIEKLITHARGMNDGRSKDFLKWVMLTVKMNILFQESKNMPEASSSHKLQYMLDEIKILHCLYEAINARGEYALVSIDLLKEELKKYILSF
ncbi:hypothetical protein ENBRE01_0228 [Enteropsectra breve]|nr:hypothetical protein ENBRE01_0228 [Enteropsectra breve]